MTAYRAFFASDYALRTLDLLKRFWVPAKACDREVTLLLTIATSGLVVPNERLALKKNHQDPSFYEQPILDRDKWIAEMTTLEVETAKTVENSELFSREEIKLWSSAEITTSSGPPDHWNGFSLESRLPVTTPVADLIYWLRNSLAHGNISVRPDASGTGLKTYTKDAPVPDLNAQAEIETLVFTSGYPPGHPRLPKMGRRMNLRFIAVSPKEFHRFLTKWLEFLSRLRIPLGLIVDT